MAAPRKSLAFGFERKLYPRPKYNATMKKFCDAAGWEPSKDMLAGRHRTKLLQVLKVVLKNRNILAVFEADNGYAERLVKSDSSLARGEGDGYCTFWEPLT